MLLNKHVGDCCGFGFFRIRLLCRHRVGSRARRIASRRRFRVFCLNISFGIRASQNCVKLIDHSLKFRAVLVSWTRQINLYVCNQMTWMRTQNNHAIRHLHSFFNVVRNNYNRLNIALFARPKLKHFLAKVFCRKNVESRERLVHKQSVWAQNQCARNAYALAHTARKLLWVRGFKAVQTNCIDCCKSKFRALFFTNASSAQTKLHIVLNRKPWHKSKGLEHDCNPWVWACKLASAILNRSLCRLNQACHCS